MNEHATEFFTTIYTPLPWWEVLLRIIYRSDFSPLLIPLFLFALGIIAKRWPSKVVEAITIILALGVTALPTIFWFNPGSMTMFNLAVSFVMTSTIFILNFVKFRIVDYAILFSCFVFLSRFAGISEATIQLVSNFGLSISALFTLVAILAMYKIRFKLLKGNLFYCWFTFMLVFTKGYASNHLFTRYVLRLGQVQETQIGTLFVWGIALIVTCALSVLLIYVIKRILNRYFDSINRMGTVYPFIERFIILNSIGILLFVGLVYYLFGRMRFTDDPVYGFLTYRQNPIFEFTNLMLLFAMMLQLSFISMVYRLTWLKDNLKVTAMENQSLAAYSSGLEKSMDDIKNIKHDVKNIFLTMGNYVERSGDKEMQEFYSKKISPFAVDEIAKSDLLGKLAGLDNEQLKAFMFYKASQAIEHDVDVELEILESSGIFQIEFIDLVRILGILLDNAIEECVEIPNGKVFIKISGNNEMISYVIKNTVRQEIKEKGIRLGISTKGKGRGKGLVGIRSILSKYSTVLLNSYFAEGQFVQNLVIHVGTDLTQ